MDMRNINVGYAIFGLTLNGKDFKIHQKGGMLSQAGDEFLNPILQLPMGVQIQKDTEIISVTKYYSKKQKAFLLFFSQYKFAGFETTPSKRPCYYAASLCYPVLEYLHPEYIEILDVLEKLTNYAKEGNIVKDEFVFTPRYQVPFDYSNSSKKGIILVKSNTSNDKRQFISDFIRGGYDIYNTVIVTPNIELYKKVSKSAIEFIEEENDNQNNATVDISEEYKKSTEKEIVSVIDESQSVFEAPNINANTTEIPSAELPVKEAGAGIEQPVSSQENNTFNWKLLVPISLLLVLFLYIFTRKPNNSIYLDRLRQDSLKIIALIKENDSLKEKLASRDLKEATNKPTNPLVEPKNSLPIEKPKKEKLVHLFKNGETAYGIAKKYKITAEQLASNNPSDIKILNDTIFDIKSNSKLFIKWEEK